SRTFLYRAASDTKFFPTQPNTRGLLSSRKPDRAQVFAPSSLVMSATKSDASHATPNSLAASKARARRLPMGRAWVPVASTRLRITVFLQSIAMVAWDLLKLRISCRRMNSAISKLLLPVIASRPEWPLKFDLVGRFVDSKADNAVFVTH